MKPGLFFIGLLLCTGSVTAERLVPERADFARGMDLELSGTSPFYRLSLPLEVYRGIVRPDLGDLRVMNGQARVVPHQLKPMPVRQAGEASMRQAKVFPLYATRDADIESILIHAPSQWREERVSIATREHVKASDEVLHGYILQLDEVDARSLRKLHLEWRVEAQGFVHRLKVEYSKDLEHWRTYKADAVIADLRYGGERLLKQEIPLGDIQARYLRLSPANDSRMIDLLGAAVEFTGLTQAVTANRLRLAQTRPGDAAGEYLFELPGPLSVVSLEILPGEKNTLLRASLYSRADPERRWTRRGGGLIYKLVAEGEPLQQTELQVERTQDRHWKLSVDTSGGGFGAFPPVLTVGWMPHSLVFAARGDGPFSLVYGSGRVGPVVADMPIAGFDEKRLQDLIGEAVQPGHSYELGGPDVLRQKMEPDWKRWLLWGVLVLGAALLGWMAWVTLRQLSA